EDRFQRCTFCGKDLVVLPNDRRGGACFDCLSLMGPDPIPCAECGADVPLPQRASGCPRCGSLLLP
ncbi:MAG: hydrogenase maturation nickel metallochaperone HypA, partial [Thermoplasmata archaeon]|nr:hydrogenase maturation nickel metallochaperone HypA [Thermoplasmata archaeon]